MCRSEIWYLIFLWVVAVLVLQGCQAGPAVDVRIDFDRFRAAPPEEARCPDQDERVAAAGAFLMEKRR
jgi:hypothetical protein